MSLSGSTLTVWGPGAKLAGGLQHVLAQQLRVGGSGGELLIQLIIDELLYPSTWRKGYRDHCETEHIR